MSFYGSLASVRGQITSILFLNGGIWPVNGGLRILLNHFNLKYSTSWKQENFDLNKISVLAIWKPVFSLNTNSRIGGYQRFFITVFATPPLQKFGKHS